MTKIDYIFHLQDALYKDLAWRKKEISDLKFQCEIEWRKKEISDLKFQCKIDPPVMIMHKSAILLIYAHWEGFIKNAAQFYLQFLNNQKLLCKDMQDNFLILHLGGAFQEEVNYKLFSHRERILNELNKSLNCKFQVCEHKTINTNSNLKFEVFKLILEQLGIPHNEFELKSHIIDQKLLKYRNAIAHGEKRPDGDIHSVVNEIKDTIVELLDKFRDQIITAAENKKYLKVNK